MSFAKKFSIYGLGLGINAVMKFLLVPYYSKALSTAQFGVVGLIWAIMPVIITLITISLQTGLGIKYYTYDKKERSNLCASIFICITAILFIIMILLKVGGMNYLQNCVQGLNSEYWYKIILTCYFTGVINIFLLVFQMEMQSKIYTFFTVFQNLLTIAILIFNISYRKMGLLGFVNGNLISTLIIAAILFFLFIIRIDIKGFEFRKDLLISVFKLSIASSVGILFGQILNAGDRYILERITNSLVYVGQYTMGYKIGEVYNNFYVATFLLVSNPVLIKYYSKSLLEYVKQINKYLELFLFGTIIVMLIYNSSLSVLFNFIIDKKYEQSQVTTILVALSYAIYGISQLVGITILVKEKITATVIFVIICTILNIILNIVLIPVFGMNGAAIATLLSYSILFIIQMYYSNKLIKINFRYISSLKGILIGSAIAFLQYSTYFLNIGIINESIIKVLLVFVYIILIIRLKLFPYINKKVYIFAKRIINNS